MSPYLPFLLCFVVLVVAFAWMGSRMKYARLNRPFLADGDGDGEKGSGSSDMETRMEAWMSESRGAEPLTVFAAAVKGAPPTVREEDMVDDGSSGAVRFVACAMPSVHAAVVRKRLFPDEDSVGVASYPNESSHPGKLLRLALASLRGERATFAPFDESVPDQSRFLDPETGVLAGGRIHSVFKKYRRRSAAMKRETALLFIAVDDWGRLKERFGDHGSASLIRELSKRLQRNLRERDVIARLSEAEFLVVMEAPLVGGGMAARRVGRLIREGPFGEGGRTEETIHLTVSIGVAAWERGMSLSLCFERADAQLQAARKLGSGRVAGDRPAGSS